MTAVCQFHHPARGIGFGVVRDGQLYDASDLWPGMAAFLRWSVGRVNRAAQLAALLAGRAPLAALTDVDRPAAQAAVSLARPIDLQEVWAAGVTYERSRHAREAESAGSGVYDRVYAAERPEIFFKATPGRTVGPFEAVAIRSDSRWNVPEPELGLVVNPALELVGFVIGNDMSSRDIEGENPLYLPQAKVYQRCCALGGLVTLTDAVPDPTDLTITLSIARDGAAAFTGSVHTGRIVRRLSDLIAYLGRENAFPAGAVLLTGTGIVPPDAFSLAAGDVVTIAIDGLGTLQNPVMCGALVTP
jgi:2-dehydro-3-deoxy-D-arabinonate dehydratase